MDQFKSLPQTRIIKVRLYATTKNLQSLLSVTSISIYLADTVDVGITFSCPLSVRLLLLGKRHLSQESIIFWSSYLERVTCLYILLQMWVYVWFVLSVVQLDQFHNTQHAFLAWVKQCGCLENQTSVCNQDNATEDIQKIFVLKRLVLYR